MPQTYVVHLGNSKELMEVAEDNVARRVLREHIREFLGVRSEDLVFAIINSMRHLQLLIPVVIPTIYVYIDYTNSFLWLMLKYRCFTWKRAGLISSSVLSGCPAHRTEEVKSAHNACCSCGKWHKCSDQVWDTITWFCGEEWDSGPGSLCKQDISSGSLFGCNWCACSELSGE